MRSTPSNRERPRSGVPLRNSASAACVMTCSTVGERNLTGCARGMNGKKQAPSERERYRSGISTANFCQRCLRDDLRQMPNIDQLYKQTGVA